MAMTAEDGFFLFFGAMMLAGAWGVVLFRQAVYGVLSLLFCFLNGTALWLVLRAEFLAMVLVVVYAGAVTVFFLGVVMMFAPSSRARLGASALWIVSILGCELAAMVLLAPDHVWTHATPEASAGPCLKDLAMVLYTRHGVALQLVGMILLVAATGATMLAMPQGAPQVRRRTGVRRDVVLVDAPSGKGLGS